MQNPSLKRILNCITACFIRHSRSVLIVLLREKKCTVKVLETHDKWFGVTYKEDKEEVVESFKKLIEEGIYSKELYSDLTKQ